MTEAGADLKQDDVIRALDHATIAEGPGGAAEMVPGLAPRPHEYLHCPGAEWEVQGGQESGDR